MEEKIVLDRKSFEALAVETRVKVLKSLKQRRKTLSEIAKEQGMSVSGIKEHLSTLEKVGLIEKMDDGHKWKYYELTKKGREVVGPKELKVWILLSLSTFALIASVFMLLNNPLATLTLDDGAVGGNLEAAYAPSPEARSADIPLQKADAHAAEAVPSQNASNGSSDFMVMAVGDVANESNSATGNITSGQETGNTTPETMPARQKEGSAPRTGPNLQVFLAVAAISLVVVLACLGILVRNRLSVSSP